MLYVFGFERTGVAVGDLYFADPDPPPGQEGAERGVRLEVRLLVPGPLPGSAYSARPIEVGRPVWRADLLESVDGPPGSFDRTHYHPQLQGWEPGRRVYDRDLSAHPVEWVGARLAGLETLLAEAGVAADPAYAGDAEALRGCRRRDHGHGQPPAGTGPARRARPAARRIRRGTGPAGLVVRPPLGPVVRPPSGWLWGRSPGWLWVPSSGWSWAAPRRWL